MKLGSIVLAGVCGMVGLVAGRATRPVPAEAVVAPVRVEPTRTIAAPKIVAVEAPPVAEVEDNEEGVDIGEALATAQAVEAARIGEHNAISGKISERGGGALPGATIVISAPDRQAQTAISDEHGHYLITGVPAGSYTLTIYYDDHTDEELGIDASDIALTIQDHEIDLKTIQIQRDYIYDIPVPSRTFEAVLGAAAGSQDDELGGSFSGGTYLENTYEVIID